MIPPRCGLTWSLRFRSRPYQAIIWESLARTSRASPRSFPVSCVKFRPDGESGIRTTSVKDLPQPNMNGAESLIRTMVAGGVDACFTNPGTSEMHIVAALDHVTEMRCVLGLFEGVVTGAADGYARMAEKPACTLLHLGPGLANGTAVRTVVAIISHREIMIGGNDQLAVVHVIEKLVSPFAARDEFQGCAIRGRKVIAIRILIGRIAHRVRFAQQFPVDVNAAVHDAQAFTR